MAPPPVPCGAGAGVCVTGAWGCTGAGKRARPARGRAPAEPPARPGRRAPRRRRPPAVSSGVERVRGKSPGGRPLGQPQVDVGGARGVGSASTRAAAVHLAAHAGGVAEDQLRAAAHGHVRPRSPPSRKPSSRRRRSAGRRRPRGPGAARAGPTAALRQRSVHAHLRQARPRCSRRAGRCRPGHRHLRVPGHRDRGGPVLHHLDPQPVGEVGLTRRSRPPGSRPPPRARRSWSTCRVVIERAAAVERCRTPLGVARSRGR